MYKHTKKELHCKIDDDYDDGGDGGMMTTKKKTNIRILRGALFVDRELD